MSNADEFIRVFNELSAFLCTVAGRDSGVPFSQLVEAAAGRSATVRKYANRLRAFGRLRNAIVHHEGYPPEIIAEPIDRALTDFKAVAAEVRAPELVIPRFQVGVRCFALNEPLRTVLEYMRQHDYSQVAVRQDGRLRLLTTEGVARYFSEWPPWDPKGTQYAYVGDALQYDLPDGFLILNSNQTVDDAREAFATELGRGQARLYALLITPGGGATEEPIGIVTPWDLLVPKHG
jgi:CBS domain-containing protein